MMKRRNLFRGIATFLTVAMFATAMPMDAVNVRAEETDLTETQPEIEIIDENEEVLPETYEIEGASAIIKQDERLLSKVEPVSERADFSEFKAIHNKEELKGIKNNLCGKYYLANDIDLAGEDWIPLGVTIEETPVGNFLRSLESFRGILDGQGHSIKNLTIGSVISADNPNYQPGVGLFGNIDDIYKGEVADSSVDVYTVQNIVFENISINYDETAAKGVGAAVGVISSSNCQVLVSNIVVTGSIASQVEAGSVVGRNESKNCEIKNCVNYAYINANTYSSGGIAAFSRGKISGCVNHGKLDANAGIVAGACGTVSDCSNYGEISGYLDSNLRDIDGYSSSQIKSVGGIVASATDIEITNCRNEGKVTAVSSFSYHDGHVGGIVGEAKEAKISGCTNTEIIDVKSNQSEEDGVNNNCAGGIVGLAETSTIEYCDNSGNISRGAGIAESVIGKISNCTNYGNIKYGAGIVDKSGLYDDNLIVEDCTNEGVIEDGSGIAGHATTVKNCTNKGEIRISASAFESGDYCFSGILGGGNAEDCHNEGNILIKASNSYTYGYIGGVVGSGTASKCTNSGKIYITVESQVQEEEVEVGYGSPEVAVVFGGVVGSGSASDCINTGDITSVSYAYGIGGIVGSGGIVEGSREISNCRNEGSIISASSCGGIAYSAQTVNQCSNYGNIVVVTSICQHESGTYGTPKAGGIVGYVGTVSNCYNAGDVYIRNAARGIEKYQGDEEDYGFGALAGGIAGNPSYVNNCYSIGKVYAEASSVLVVDGRIF